MSQIKFSVIIPTYHRNDLLAQCLNCLAPSVQTLPADEYEVIVTDDGSQTTAQEMIKQDYPWAKWVAGPRKGPAANRNNGAKYAQGEWLAFTDDDCLPDPQWLEGYAKAIFDEPDCLVFEGRTYVDRPRRSLAETAPTNETGGCLWSCNFAVKKQLFEALGGFDERFPYAAMEDVEFRLRLTKTGHKYLFVKEASLCHPWRYMGGWQKMQQHNTSVFIYLSTHPQESATINSIYYLKLIFRGFLNEMITGIFTLKGKGVREILLQRIAWLHMAILFIIKYKSVNI
ncbi:MAG: hypothetical protein RLZZ507_971 [Cyanobacteriota bacterium]|jgi:GT2 family glycosyltransferase